MKNNKILPSLLICSFSIVILTTSIIFYINTADNSSSLRTSSSVFLVIGNSNIQKGGVEDDFIDTINLSLLDAQSKNYQNLLPVVKKIKLTFEKNKNNEPTLMGSSSLSGINFYLHKIIGESTSVSLKQDNSGNFSIISPSVNFKVGDSILSTEEINLYATSAPYLNGKVIKYNNKIRNLEKENFETLGKISNNNIVFLDMVNKNLLENTKSSFENFSNEKVQDCTRLMTGAADITLLSSDDSTDGEKSAVLGSKNHHACIIKNFPIVFDADKIYLLSFDYKNVKGNELKMYYKLSDSSEVSSSTYEYSEIIGSPDTNWNTFSTLIEPKKIIKKISNRTKNPFKINAITVNLYAPSDGSSEIINKYDNLRLTEYLVDDSRQIKINKYLSKDLIVAGPIKIGRENELIQLSGSNNFLSSLNYSFETSLWSNFVNDCSQGKGGSPEIGMRKDRDATEGNYSLYITSSNHFACTSKAFPVNLKKEILYKLSFDSKSLEGGELQFFYNLKSEEGDAPFLIKKKIPINEWKPQEVIINSDIGNVKNLEMFFYAASDGSKKITNLYDNLRLTEWLPKDIDSYYLQSDNLLKEEVNNSSINSKAITLWQSKVTIKNVKKTFLLISSNEYSLKWKLSLNDVKNDNFSHRFFFKKRTEEEADHFQANNYENAWLVNVEKLCIKENKCHKNLNGSYDIEMIIEFTPQRWFYLGLLISGTTLLSCLAYLGYDFVRNRRRRGSDVR